MGTRQAGKAGVRGSPSDEGRVRQGAVGEPLRRQRLGAWSQWLTFPAGGLLSNGFYLKDVGEILKFCSYVVFHYRCFICRYVF